MTIVKELADLRAGYPGCQVVVFADLTTGMVLASSTAAKTTQEKLDGICEAGRECLLGAPAKALASVLSTPVSDGLCTMWRTDKDEARCYVKLPAPAGEALCIVAKTDVPLDRLSADARALLSRIAGE